MNEREGWDDDAVLLAGLGRALAEASATPERVGEIGRAAFTWRTVDAELIELTVQDSVGDPVRAQTGPIRATFAGTGVIVETERDGDVLRGQLVPPGPGVVDVIGGAETRSVDVSDDGYFVLRELPSTSIRLRIRVADVGFVTPWFGLDG
jgi:hypothetical protein